VMVAGFENVLPAGKHPEEAIGVVAEANEAAGFGWREAGFEIRRGVVDLGEQRFGRDPGRPRGARSRSNHLLFGGFGIVFGRRVEDIARATILVPDDEVAGGIVAQQTDDGFL
jgi:hypothetical protein